jgi:DNA (cytosine-5)-methyltransferase 1
MLTHFSLFTGIGGIDLAAEWAGFTTVGQCEWADYPTKVLEKHWPDVPRWRDVRDVTVESIRERGIEEITLLSGGFPCQPHSLAGKRKASTDERNLWPEYRRVISEVRPKWVLAENVRGLLSSEDGRFFRRILRDLSELGFDVGWCTYPSSWIGTIHKRERVFTIAHAVRCRLEKQDEIKKIPNEARQRTPGQISCAASTMGLHKFGDIGDIRKSDGVPHWMDRLKCLGNAVVPQQVYPILKAIAEIERSD